jgi:predicted RNA-binding protein with PUA-like domain
MAYWLLKTEPDEFSFEQLRACGARGEIWDGIRNHQAAGYLRQMRRGDEVFIYHTGKEKRIVGTGEVLGAAFADEKDESGRFVAVKVRARAALATPVTLAAIKTTPALAEFVLLRQGRLSVMPVTDAEWQAIHHLAL